ncbi:glycosyltransferase family 2 protein [Clostridium aciditolerans]|uniref:Glycosyltransferase family 2 protein n=2 Tax=Clostridium aciditolerans TaxID=339861 RepID=A0A934I458_9CLOT|nr:glycosyltransferase family 2 protein [Clostridium aciditolerans]
MKGVTAIMEENLPKVTIITLAYNVEKYIHQCIKSVLDQSFTEFQWVILDNGCTDGTSEILEEYAKKDKRIKLFKNKRNSLIYDEPNVNEFTQYIENLDTEYYCTLDSDDYIHKDFLKELYEIAKLNNADISVCAVHIFEDENPQAVTIRYCPDFCTKDITKIGDIFPQIYNCFRPMWGKLVKTEIIKKTAKYIAENNIKVTNGADTINCIQYLRFSNTLVAVNKELYYYRTRNDSLYNSNIGKDRYMAYLKIYTESKSLLESWNKLDNNNLNFIASMLNYSLIYCVYLAANVTRGSIKERIEVITAILSDKSVREILNDSGLLFDLIDECIKSLNRIAKRSAN